MQPRYLALCSDHIDRLPLWAEHTVVPCLCTGTLNSIVTPRHFGRRYCLEGYLGTNAFWCILGLRYLHHKMEKETLRKKAKSGFLKNILLLHVCKRVCVQIKNKDREFGFGWDSKTKLDHNHIYYSIDGCNPALFLPFLTSFLIPQPS